MYFFFFLIFSNLSIFFGLVLVFFQNPMYSILSLIGCIFCSVIILFMYGIEFMSFVYLVVYIGAIAILFLFMIMMLNINTFNFVSVNSSIDIYLLYFCIFLKSVYSVFVINKMIFFVYLDHLQEIVLDVDLVHFLSTFSFKKSFNDSLVNSLTCGLDSTSDLIAFCNLYNIYFLYFILAGMILLFAMLGAISLCIVKPK